MRDMQLHIYIIACLLLKGVSVYIFICVKLKIF